MAFPFFNQFNIGTFSKVQTTAGTTQATAATMVADCVYVPTSSAIGSGIIMPAGQDHQFGVVINADQTSDFILYPPVGGQFNGATANVGIQVPPKASLFYWWFDANLCGVVLSH